jgi:hypothetical protein
MEHNSYYDVNRYDDNYETYNPRRYRAGSKSVASSVSTKVSTSKSSGTRSSSSTLSPGSVEETFEYRMLDGKLLRDTIQIKNVTPFKTDGPKAKLKYERTMVKSEIIDTSGSFECIICGLEDEAYLLTTKLLKQQGKEKDMDSTIAKFDSFLQTVITLQKTFPDKKEKIYMLVRFITNNLRKAFDISDDDGPSVFTKYYVDNYPNILTDDYKEFYGITKGVGLTGSSIKDSSNALTGYIPISFCKEACIIIGQEPIKKGGYTSYHITGGYDRIEDYDDYYSRGGYSNDYEYNYSRGGYDGDYHSSGRDYYSRGGYDRDYHSYDRDYHSYDRDYYPNSMHGGALGEFRKEINRDIYKSLRDDILNMQLD